MPKFKVAIVVGSNRRESINRKLAGALAKLGDGKLSVKFVRIDDLPIYNQDLESPLPASVGRFKAEIAPPMRCCSSPRSTTAPFRPSLKNAIDWGCAALRDRTHGRESRPPSPAHRPARSATAIAQQHLRQILGNLGVLVMGGEAYITFKPGLIDDAGAIADDGTRAFLQAFVDQFAALLARLSGRDTVERACLKQRP